MIQGHIMNSDRIFGEDKKLPLSMVDFPFHILLCIYGPSMFTGYYDHIWSIDHYIH